MTCSFFVAGTPAPQGSKNAYVRGGRAVMVESSKRLKPWREAIAGAARASIAQPTPEPVTLLLTFFMPRPKRNPRLFPSVKPDIDKLARAVCDALTGIAYNDDAQVIGLMANKIYSETPGVAIQVATRET